MLKSTFQRWLNCFRLLNGQTFEQPSKLLLGQILYLLFVSWPLQLPAVQPLIEHRETVAVEIQTFVAVLLPTSEQEDGIAIGIQLKGVLDQCCQSINPFSHIGLPANDIDVLDLGVVLSHR